MKVRMTFVLTEEQLRAIARRFGCKRPATRSQVIQFIAGSVADYTAEAVSAHRRFVIPGPQQGGLFDAAAPRQEAPASC